MKFRKKPVEVEAMQLFQTDFDFVYEKETKGTNLHGFYHQFMGCSVWLITNKQGIVEASIRTLEGDMKINDGDWIIKGVAGEFYPCKPDIFEKTYEPVNE
jgi:hypothetical protein